MITLYDVEYAASQTDGELPEAGQVWRQKDGRLVRVTEITSNSFSPVTVHHLDGSHESYRTRDGRNVVFGVRGCDPEDLMEKVDCQAQEGGE